MIQKQSYLNVADNSGAKELMCIHIVGGTRKRFAYLGDKIKCAVKKAIPGGMVKKGDVVDAIIVRTRKDIKAAQIIRIDIKARTDRLRFDVYPHL